MIGNRSRDRLWAANREWGKELGQRGVGWEEVFVAELGLGGAVCPRGGAGNRRCGTCSSKMRPHAQFAVLDCDFHGAAFTGVDQLRSHLAVVLSSAAGAGLCAR